MTDALTCTCDDAHLMRAGIKGREIPACSLHRPEIPHAAAMALNGPEIASSIARALRGTVTDNSEETF